MRTAVIFILVGIPATAQAPRTVDAVRVISGAVLAEGFDQPELDSSVWHRPDWLLRHNPYIGVAPEHGQLHLSGISRPAGAVHQYVGIISSNYLETDVVLAANLRVRSAFDRERRIQHYALQRHKQAVFRKPTPRTNHRATVGPPSSTPMTAGQIRSARRKNTRSVHR